MATLIVPDLDLGYPTLGPAVKDFIEERLTFGPGSLAGQPAVLDDEKTAALYRAYEVYPRGHELAGRRRFHRVAIEWAKGKAKTEWAAWLAIVELHPEAPARCDGFDAHGNPVGRPVVSPYIPMMAASEEQVSDLAYFVVKAILEESGDADLFDIGLDRILRLDSRGRAAGRMVPVAGAPNSRDGALTTFQNFDEPHRLYLPTARAAHETMTQNLTKRPMEDPWSLYTSTAGQPGQNSVEEELRQEAEELVQGIEKEAQLVTALLSQPLSLPSDTEAIDSTDKEISGPQDNQLEVAQGQAETIDAEADSSTLAPPTAPVNVNYDSEMELDSLEVPSSNGPEKGDEAIDNDSIEVPASFASDRDVEGEGEVANVKDEGDDGDEKEEPPKESETVTIKRQETEDDNRDVILIRTKDGGRL